MQAKALTAVTVASFLALAACGGDPGADPATGGQGIVTITYAFWGNNDEAATIKSMIAAFEKANPAVKVEANWIQSDYEQKLQTSIAGGDAPTVAQISNTALPSFANAFTPVEVDHGVYYSPAVAKAGNVGGTDYAVPFVAKSKVMAVNKAAFEAAGLAVPSGSAPMSTADFVAAARKLTSGSGEKKVYGSAPLWYDGWLVAEGGSYYSADGRTCTMGNADGIRAAQVVVDSTKPDGFAPSPADTQGQDMFQWFADGKVAMLPDFGPWNIAKLAALDTAKFLVVPMPGKGEPMEVDSLGISKSAEQAEASAARTFATFMSTSPAAQNLLASTTSALGVPVVQGSLESFKSIAPKVNLQAFVDAVTDAVTTAYVKDKVKIESTFSTDLNSRTAIGSGTEDPAAVLPELQAQCQQMLDATK
ncbi:extracellular solute-binding protein [Nonomuraea gerenzanensis]|uniref:N-Acetyl-D-glucosamine ABC transport system, sugar-binding protein n=1 Tax=Nonomuraea gerenzanensis TaxID=93944 RepID=A0A1M4EF77_9ACTN|nr:extracellular solute-binding protein [Nonomuraea gerenzanensis]UBU09075.1 extracellular solute-binding protein [Nonomuraea gerenzanensis]SBO97460.1 N-Acetyl-D-glucosamine ABC transport system, sugar-binding protein [Nonomuraea gerenzanensis]